MKPIQPFPSEFSERTLSLADGAVVLGEAGDQAIQKLADKGYEVHVGLTPEFAKAISVMAQEAAIREFCLRIQASVLQILNLLKNGWLKKRSMFLLLKRTDGDVALAGYGWAGAGSSSHVPSGETTFAIRIGELGQGQGLASSFAWLIVAGSASLYGAKDMWLETWKSNGGAVHVYHKIGFEDVVQEPDQRLLPGGETVADTRIYMSLPNRLLPETGAANS